MIFSDCHKAKIIRHPINHQLQCSACGKIQSSKTIIRDMPGVKKERKDPFIKAMDKTTEFKPRKPRIYTEAQIYHIQKAKEEKEWEQRKNMRKEVYFNSLKHSSNDS